MTARALVVAVPHGSWSNLPYLAAVPNDARAIVQVLISHGFACENIDAAPDGLTKSDFLERIWRLRDATQAGDLALFYFSGHGWLVDDDNHDEVDRKDECLVLNDDGIRDDWWAEDFWPTIHDGSRWVTLVDACFSASSVCRAARPENSGVGADGPRTPAGPRRLRVPPSPHLGYQPEETVPAGHIGSWRLHLAAAADDAQSFIVPTQHGKPTMSAWTSALIDQMDRHPDLTYRSLSDALQAATPPPGVTVNTACLTHVSVNDQLLDSQAFSPLTW